MEKLVGMFPFGWIRNIRNDNWQIIWDPKSNTVFLRGAKSKDLLEFCNCSSWQEAKIISGDIRSKPSIIEEKFS